MKEELKEILSNMKKYNSSNMAYECFGFDKNIEYDALIIAPGWKPTKILDKNKFKVTSLKNHSYIEGFFVEANNKKIAWAQIASGACNLIDHLIILSELNFKYLIFVGAVGSLTKDISVGSFCTPSCCIQGSLAPSYLNKKLSNYDLFRTTFPPQNNLLDKLRKIVEKEELTLKEEKVFCTDSISLEYSHLDEILKTDAKLIEMETQAFYKLASLIEIPSIALLAVSDNLETKDPLLGRDNVNEIKYNNTRKIIIPNIILKLIED